MTPAKLLKATGLPFVNPVEKEDGASGFVPGRIELRRGDLLFVAEAGVGIDAKRAGRGTEVFLAGIFFLPEPLADCWMAYLRSVLAIQANPVFEDVVMPAVSQFPPAKTERAFMIFSNLDSPTAAAVRREAEQTMEAIGQMLAELLTDPLLDECTLRLCPRCRSRMFAEPGTCYGSA